MGVNARLVMVNFINDNADAQYLPACQINRLRAIDNCGDYVRGKITKVGNLTDFVCVLVFTLGILGLRYWGRIVQLFRWPKPQIACESERRIAVR